MSLKCKIGLHSWVGCKCSGCGATRDKEHDLSNGCGKCSKCGKELDLHDWSKNCEKCSKCGKTREAHHSWEKDCEKCSSCGETRSDKHHKVNGICQVCGHGTFVDENDKRTYKTIKIGEQIIMAENFARKPASGNCWAYDEHSNNVTKYGYLYDLATAKAIVPKGWHLPTKAEWETLHHFLGDDDKKVYDHLKTGGSSGFDGVFGGWRSAKGTFNGLAASAHFWSDTADGDGKVWHFKLGAFSHKAELEKGDSGLALSVRLFLDK